jgi:hypothetical protein
MTFRNLRYCLLDWPVSFVSSFHLRHQTCTGSYRASTSRKSIRVVYEVPQFTPSSTISDRICITTPRLSVKKHTVSSYLPYVDLSSFTFTLLRVVLPSIISAEFIISAMRVSVEFTISAMRVSVEFIIGTAFAAVMAQINLGEMWWQVYFIYH